MCVIICSALHTCRARVMLKHEPGSTQTRPLHRERGVAVEKRLGPARRSSEFCARIFRGYEGWTGLSRVCSVLQLGFEFWSDRSMLLFGIGG